MLVVGKDLKDHEVPIRCHGQRQLPLDQVLSELALNTDRAGAPPAFWAACLNVSLTTRLRIFSRYLTKFPLFLFVPITLCPMTTFPDKESLSGFPLGSLQVLECCYEVSMQPSLVWAQQPQLPQTVLTEKGLQPSFQLCGPPLVLFQ